MERFPRCTPLMRVPHIRHHLLAFIRPFAVVAGIRYYKDFYCHQPL
jgi:hypothetical protein